MSYYYSSSSTSSSSSYSSPTSSYAPAPPAAAASASLSRPASVSPQFSNAYTFYSASRFQFQASRGFDVEDDLVFCPALSSERASSSSKYHHHYSTNRVSSGSSDLHTPEASPTFTNPILSHHQQQVSPTPTPARARRAINIVDPSTGLKVTSPLK